MMSIHQGNFQMQMQKIREENYDDDIRLQDESMSGHYIVTATLTLTLTFH